MKLAIFGGVIGAAGLTLGVDGLLYAGGFWAVTGLLLAWTLSAVRQGRATSISDPSIHNPTRVSPLRGTRADGYHDSWWTFVLTMFMGLGSMAIGLFAIGFEGDDAFLRWLPFGVGVLLTAISLTSISIRLGGVDLDQAPSEDSEPRRRPFV